MSACLWKCRNKQKEGLPRNRISLLCNLTKHLLRYVIEYFLRKGNLRNRGGIPQSTLGSFRMRCLRRSSKTERIKIFARRDVFAHPKPVQFQVRCLKRE